ncbi:hypothetical protein O181_054136 [Austropuccinia psidii MF-1]|uniref:Uncharacterized protein n=1 Tax=Austropuccinia psidii MF-1 TaxID=1389203 RepID=A0A9Q3HQT9_9BASI|nr:hypothetical protein [Austropuccinia psidii MF-1]
MVKLRRSQLLQQLQHPTKAQLRRMWAKLKLSRSSCSTRQRPSFNACGRNCGSVAAVAAPDKGSAPRHPLSHISQLHPFDAPCWKALPNYGTDARVIQAAFTRLEDILLPVFRPAIFLVGCLIRIRIIPAYDFVGISHSGSFSERFQAPRASKDPDANLSGLVPASNAIGVNVYVDHSSRPAPPWIMPHIPPWNPSAHHQSAKNFRPNQAHVWWRATDHISPAHTQTSPQ